MPKEYQTLDNCHPIIRVPINDRGMAAFVMWNETLSSAQRRELVVALTRRSHENAVRLKGEVITEQDKSWHEALYAHTWHGYQEEHVPSLLSAFPDNPSFEPFDSDECLRALADSLSPVMGKISRRNSQVICTKQIGDWKIITKFALHRRDEMIDFVYDFVRKDGEPTKQSHPAQGPFPRSLGIFYGLGITFAGVPSRVDGQRMAKVMARLAEYFVAQAPPLFVGLGIEDLP